MDINSWFESHGLIPTLSSRRKQGGKTKIVVVETMDDFPTCNPIGRKDTCHTRMWTARSVAIERKKLCSTEGDWKNLAGFNSSTDSGDGSQATRYGGQGRPNLLRYQQQDPLTASSGSKAESEVDTEEEQELDDASIESNTKEEEDETKKPPPGNVILEVNGLTNMWKRTVIAQSALVLLKFR
jgi:hypothetical protein